MAVAATQKTCDSSAVRRYMTWFALPGPVSALVGRERCPYHLLVVLDHLRIVSYGIAIQHFR